MRLILWCLPYVFIEEKKLIHMNWLDLDIHDGNEKKVILDKKWVTLKIKRFNLRGCKQVDTELMVLQSL